MVCGFQFHQGGAPPAPVFMGKSEGHDFLHPVQNGMHCSQRSSCPFAVYDANLQQIFFATGGNVVGEQALQLAWVESVQIKNAVNGQFDRIKFIIHLVAI